jgi:hypothetical protein
VKAAKKLADSNSAIKLAKVDATLEADLASENDIKGYPTLKFYKKGKAMDYSGNNHRKSKWSKDFTVTFSFRWPHC